MGESNQVAGEVNELEDGDVPGQVVELDADGVVAPNHPGVSNAIDAVDAQQQMQDEVMPMAPTGECHTITVDFEFVWDQVDKLSDTTTWKIRKAGREFTPGCRYETRVYDPHTKTELVSYSSSCLQALNAVPSLAIRAEERYAATQKGRKPVPVE